MNTRDLQYFTALVRYKNYTEVAKKFGVSQPTITQAIQRLESEFNAQLIIKNRGQRGAVITRSGQLLYENAKFINDRIELTHKDIKRVNRKQIRFGLPPIIGKMYISQIVKEFRNDLLPRLQIISVGSHELLGQLRQGKIEIALLGSTTPIHEPGIYAQLITMRPFSVIVSTNHPLAKKGHISFKDLTQEKFILYDTQYVHKSAFNAYCTYAHIKPKVVMYRIPNISWVKELVRQNLGIGLLVKDAAKNEPGIATLNIDDPLPERFYISIAMREGYVPSDDEKSLVDRLQGLKTDYH